MNPEIYEAATLGDTKILGRIRGAGEVSSIDIYHQKTPNESNIFHIAAEFKQIEFFKKVPLDEQSFQLFWAVNKKGDTPLHVAARAGCNEIVRLLIDQPKTLHNGRADQERGQSDGEAQKELLQMTNKNQDTALHIATRYRHFEVVKLLVEANPQLCGLTNNSNESPLFLAIRQDFLVAADVFIKSSVPPSFEGINGVTALHAAVNLTDKEAEVIVKDLVGKYPETITKTDQLGWTPLHYAALSGNVEASRVLVQGSTSVTYMLDRSGMSALHVAAYAGQTKVMEELIRRRPDSCHLVNHKGQTILHTAVMGGQRSSVKWILNSPNLEGLINEADKDGNTALHLAALYGEGPMALILMKDRRVDRTAINKELSMADDIFNKYNMRMVLASDVDVPNIGVPYLEQNVLRSFLKLNSLKHEIPGTSAIADKQRENKLQTYSHEALKAFDTNLVVAILIATVTFAAAFTVPGGYKSNGIAALHGNTSFQLFMICNAFSFFFSMIVVFEHFVAATVLRSFIATPDDLIQYSIAGMMIAFASGMFAILPKNHPLGFMAYLICGWFCVVVIFIFKDAVRAKKSMGFFLWFETHKT